MKTTTTIASIAMIIASSMANSQITITQNDLPSVGQSKLINSAMDLEIDFTTTGANKTWNFASISPLSQAQRSYESPLSGGLLVTFTFGPTAGNYAATYSAPAVDLDLSQVSGLLPITVENVKQFYKKSATALNTVGYSAEISGQGVPVKSDTIETKYVLPLTFGASYSSRGYTYLNTSPLYTAEVKQFRQRSSEVDGWGTVVTPLGSFPALRVKHRITEQDSLNLTGNWLGLNQPVKFEYEWLAAGKSEPVFKITTRMVNNSEIVSGIEYLTDVVLDANTLGSIELNMYPNPVKDQLTIQSDEMLDVLQIIDLNGKVVLTQENVMSGTSFNIGELTSGIYQIVAERAGVRQMHKIVKQ